MAKGSHLWNLHPAYQDSLQSLMAEIRDAADTGRPAPCTSEPARWQQRKSKEQKKAEAHLTRQERREIWTREVLTTIVECHSCPVFDACRTAADIAQETGHTADLLDVVWAGRFLGESRTSSAFDVIPALASKDNIVRLLAMGLTDEEVARALPTQPQQIPRKGRRRKHRKDAA